jgi:Ankyrin repeats (3 copies)
MHNVLNQLRYIVFSYRNMINLTSGLSELSLALADLDWVRAEYIVQSKPHQASQWVVRHGLFEGVRDAHCLPLHESCITSAPASTVKAILCANLSAARTRETAYRRLPLHCVCRRRESTNDCSDIVRDLINAYPAGCLVPDDLGRLPIHYALSNGAPAHVIHMLLSANPKAARGVDNRGWTPLHVACSAGASLSVIQALLQECPEAVVLHTKKGSIPIQCLPNNMSDRHKAKQLLKEARIEFDSNFVSPMNENRKTLLHDNHDVVLV